MHNLCSVALHLSAISTFRVFVYAQSQNTPWQTVLANDPSVTWTPSVSSCRPGGRCGGWYELDVPNHKYIVGQAPSPTNQISYKFQGSAIEVYGGAIGRNGRGAVSLDGQQQQDHSFQIGLASQKVASFSDLDTRANHTLTFTFVDSPPTMLGLDYFRIQPVVGSPSSNQGPNNTSRAPTSSSSTPIRPTGNAASPGRQGSMKTGVSLPHPGNPSSGHSAIAPSPIGSPSSLLSGGLTPHPSPESTGTAFHGASDHSGPRPWEIAVLVLGILALLLSAVVGFCLWRRRRTRALPGDVADEKLPPVQSTSRPGTHTPENPGPTPSASTGYAFTRPGSSVSTSRPTAWRNSRIGVSPYTYERAVPYPESTTERSSWIDPMPIPTPTRRSITTVPEVVPTRHISFSGKGRILKVQNPETRSTTSVTETDTAH